MIPTCSLTLRDMLSREEAWGDLSSRSEPSPKRAAVCNVTHEVNIAGCANAHDVSLKKSAELQRRFQPVKNSGSVRAVCRLENHGTSARILPQQPICK
jgi:hypothetical protein